MPHGEDALGYICYSDRGVMTVQISRRARSEPTDAAQLEQDYLAYFGRYEIDPGREVVRHILEGQLIPGHFPAVLERTYRFEGDFLRLSPVGHPHQEILWQRVR